MTTKAPLERQTETTIENCALEDAELDAVVGGSGSSDKAIPKLWTACCKGTHLPEVVL